MNTWNEAGKGRKQCPTCKIYVGVRSSNCKCGFSFAAEKVREKKAQIKTAETKNVSLKKVSGKITTSNSKQEEVPQEEEWIYQYTNHVILSTPSGMCPVELAIIGRPQVKEWATKLVQFHAKKGEKLKPEALKYYVRHFHNVLTDEFHQACYIIDEIKDEVGLYV